MNKKTFLIITIFSIFILVVISSYTEQTYSGKIKTIEAKNTKTTIILKDYNETFVSFDKISVEECNEVEISGKEDTYKNKKQIIIDKIKCLN